MRPLPAGWWVRVRQTTLTRAAGKGLSRTCGCSSAFGIDDLRVRVNSAGGSGATHGLTSLRWSSRRANSASRQAAHRGLTRGEQWSAALHRLGVQWEAPESQGILRYGMVRAVSDTAIIVVKRNERHQWTATAARQDADATTAQVMAMERR